ncbi:MAG: nucleoside hydrolase [Pirellulales bacterium]|nr:nucleoside hydrolase [Pirellulales bacterium]
MPRLASSRTLVSRLLMAILCIGGSASFAGEPENKSVPVIFDTDMGNDIDDVFALGLLHGLQSRGECKIIAVTVSKDHELAGPFCDVINTFYGCGNIPIGVLRTAKPSGDGPYLTQVMAPGKFKFSDHHQLLKKFSDAPLAVTVLRKTLATQRDGSVVVIAVGPMTNLASLLNSPADQASDLTGKELVAAKVRLLVVMAGDFSRPKAEFNVFSDRDSAATVLATWPTELIACPFEMGSAIHYPSLDNDFHYVEGHPLLMANLATFGGRTNGFMAWDLVATLHAIRPDRGYFNLSKPGTIRLDAENVTHHDEDASGKHRYLMPRDNTERVREAISGLASQPPAAKQK